MNIVAKEDYPNLSVRKIEQTVDVLKRELKNHEGVAYSFIYGSVATEDYDEFSDIDIVVIYYNETFLDFIRSLYEEGKITAEVEWKLIPIDLLKNGIPIEERFFKTILLKNIFVGGDEGFVENITLDFNCKREFILQKIIKASEYFVKGNRDLKEISKMMRGVVHVPRVMINYVGIDSNELHEQYLEFLKPYSALKIKDYYESILHAKSSFKEFARSKDIDYDFALIQAASITTPYLNFLIANYRILQ